MARQPTPEHHPIALIGPHEGAAIDAKAAEAGAMATADQLLRQMLEGGAADALMAAGRIQAMHAVEIISGTVIAQTYEKIRKSKAYVGLPYRNQDGLPETISTLEQFAEVYLGRSGRRCRQIAANVNALGTELYEVAESIGFRQADHDAFRNLPSDDQEAVKLAMASDNKDRAMEVMADLVARQAQQKAAAEDKARVFEGERDEARKDYDAATALLGQAKAKIRRMEGGDLRPMRLDEQMSEWPTGCGALIGEIRRHLTQIGLIIQSAEQLPIPEPSTPDADIHSRAMRMLYDSLSGPLSDLLLEVQGVDVHLNRIVGPFAYPGDDAPSQMGAAL